MARFYWDDLLDSLAQKRDVVPVIGCGLIDFPEKDGGRAFAGRLTERCAHWLGEHYDLEIAEETPLSKQLAATRRATA